MVTSADERTLTEASSPAATIQRFVRAFNESDEEGLAACFAQPCSILDAMAPHVWLGSSAAHDWHKDGLAMADRLGITDPDMKLGPPTHDAVVGDAAYFTAPATFGFKVQGQQVNQSGAMLTAALRRFDSDWRITGWAWTKGGGGGVDDVSQSTA